MTSKASPRGGRDPHQRTPLAGRSLPATSIPRVSELDNAGPRPVPDANRDAEGDRGKLSGNADGIPPAAALPDGDDRPRKATRFRCCNGGERGGGMVVVSFSLLIDRECLEGNVGQGPNECGPYINVRAVVPRQLRSWFSAKPREQWHSRDFRSHYTPPTFSSSSFFPPPPLN